MQVVKVSHISKADFKYFERSFYEVVNTANNDITFSNLREIANNYKKFNRGIITKCLENILKRMTSQNEDDVYISNIYSKLII
jgi:hypothetical protein